MCFAQNFNFSIFLAIKFPMLNNIIAWPLGTKIVIKWGWFWYRRIAKGQNIYLRSSYGHLEVFRQLYIPIFANFFGSYWKKILKKGQMSWNWCHLSGEHEFWAKFGSRAKIDRGGSWSPPPNLARPLRRQTD